MQSIVSCSLTYSNLENKNELLNLLNFAFLESLPLLEKEFENKIKIAYSLN